MNHHLAPSPGCMSAPVPPSVALTAFPVWVEGPSVRGLHWSGQQLAVGELAGGPSVSQLQVSNGSTRPAVLLEGDLVEGGWQNRMLGREPLVRLARPRCSRRGASSRAAGTARGAALTRRRAAYSVNAAARDHTARSTRVTCGSGSGGSSSCTGDTPQRLDDGPPGRPAGAAAAAAGGSARRDHRHRRPGGRRRDLRPLPRSAEPVGRHRRRRLAGRPARTGGGRRRPSRPGS